VRRARRASSTMCLEMIVDPARQARFLSTRSVTHKGQVRASSARICRETFTSPKPRSPCALSARLTQRTVDQQELRYSTASVSLDSGAPTDKLGLSVTLGENTISKALVACLDCSTCVHAYRISSAATVESVQFEMNFQIILHACCDNLLFFFFLSYFVSVSPYQ